MLGGQGVLRCQSQYPSVRAGNPSILRPASKDITSASVLLCDTAVCFLHVHEIGTKGLGSENAQYSTRCGLGVCQVSSEFCVLEQAYFAVTCMISSTTVLSVVSNMVNIADWSCESHMACSVPFRHKCCQIIHGLENVQSANANHVQAFPHDVRANFR